MSFTMREAGNLTTGLVLLEIRATDSAGIMSAMPGDKLNGLVYQFERTILQTLNRHRRELFDKGAGYRSCKSGKWRTPQGDAAGALVYFHLDPNTKDDARRVAENFIQERWALFLENNPQLRDS